MLVVSFDHHLPHQSDFQSQDRTLNEQEKRQVLDTIENQDGQVGTEGNFPVDAIRHKDDEAS